MNIKAIKNLTTGDRVFTFSPKTLRRTEGDISLIDSPDKIVEAIFLQHHNIGAEKEGPRCSVADANNGDLFNHVPSFYIFASRGDARKAVLKAIEAKQKEFNNRAIEWLGAVKDTSKETG